MGIRKPRTEQLTATGPGGRALRWAVLLLAATAALLAAPAAQAAPPSPPGPLSTCFWEGPISTEQPTSSGFDGRNFNFPEESATYWLARLRLPAGARLVLHGRYAHARYESFNAYTSGAPSDGIADFEIAPDPGSTNPFLAGAPRNKKGRDFRVTVLPGAPPAPGEPRSANTLYAGAAFPQELALRVYTPDNRRDLSGDGGLPSPELVLADGSVLEGDAVCAAINDPNRTIPVLSIPAALWQFLVHTPGGDPATSPAFDPPRWERFFNQNYAATVFREAAGLPRPADPGPDGGGFYSNRDNRYILTHLSRSFGPVVVIRAKLPTFPRTENGQKPLGGEQLRFWSLCSGESRVTTRTPDCLADSQLPLDSDRRYTIVVSKAADRPANAERRCGVAWLDWGENGDAAGRPDYGLLIMRNMLPSAGFAEAIQNIKQPGQEAAVMGPYLPQSEYTTKEAFEARGCAPPATAALGPR